MTNTLEFLHCRADMLERMLENALPENAAILRAIKVEVELEIAVGVEQLATKNKRGLRLVWNRVMGN